MQKHIWTAALAAAMLGGLATIPAAHGAQAHGDALATVSAWQTLDTTARAAAIVCARHLAQDAPRASCASCGSQPGSDAFAECVQEEQHRHTLHIALRPTAAPAVATPALSQPQPAQAPALPPLPQPRTQFCFGSGAFEQCQ